MRAAASARSARPKSSVSVTSFRATDSVFYYDDSDTGYESDDLSFGDVLNSVRSISETERASSRYSLIQQHSTTPSNFWEKATGDVKKLPDLSRPSSRSSAASSAVDIINRRYSESARQSKSRPGTSSSAITESASMSRSEMFKIATLSRQGALKGVKPCKRMESVLSDEMAAKVTDLSRQCCDVLGAEMCMECTKNVSQHNTSVAYHKMHPDIDDTAITLYAIPLVQRMFPHLSGPEIQTKLASGEISQVKMKVNTSKEIHQFDDAVTHYLPEKYRRRRMRQQRIQSGRGLDEDEDVLPFNPYHYIDSSSTSRMSSRRNALFPTDFMRSGASTPSSTHTVSRLPTPETPPASPTEEVAVAAPVHFGTCQPSLLDQTWARDFPRFFITEQNREYKLPVWRRCDLPPDP